MATVVVMPKHGHQMTEGLITQWIVQEGEACTAGEPLFEIEHAKATDIVEAEVSGILLKILHGEGEEVPITEPIAVIGEAGEDISAILGSSASAAGSQQAVPIVEENAVAAFEKAETAHVPSRKDGEKVLASPRAKLRASENGVDLSDVPYPGSGQDGILVERDVFAYMDSRPKATPLAKKIAASEGISLENVSGNGPFGKVTAGDLVENTDRQEDSRAAATKEGAAPVQMSRGIRREKMSGMRLAIMKNMLESRAVNAQTHHRITVDMTEAMALREKYKELGIKVSYNDIIARACAKALTDSPVVNASTEGNEIVYHDYVNIGIAVSVEDGLIVPVIKDADIIGLPGIAKKSAELIEKAREGKLKAEEYRGGTFTVSSLGMFGLDDFVAIINPPESAILAVGRITKTPVVESGEDGEDIIAIRPLCAMCLSYDHRIIDGAEGAKFLQKVKQYLENPLLLI